MNSGFILIDKEEGWTSRDVCNKVQSIFDVKKVGHIGTLDPFATGLLVVSINKATKAGQFVDDDRKIYTATLVLGEKRDGGDKTGEIIQTKDVPLLNEEIIKETLKLFVGEIDQVPPLKSAVHFNGRKLYQYAYSGEVVTPEPRKVFVHSLTLISFKDNKIIFQTEVSKGTFIRTLGEDIALKLGTVGYLEALRRESINDLSVKNAKKLSEINENDILPIPTLLTSLYHIHVDEVLEKKAKDGLTIFFKNIEGYDNILLISPSGEAISVYERKEGDLFKPLRGLF